MVEIPNPRVAVDVDPGYDRILASVVRLRSELFDQIPEAAGESMTLAVYGVSILAQFELRHTDFFPPNLVAAETRATYEEIGRRFFVLVLPDESTVRQLSSEALAAYQEALSDSRRDPGLFAAAFGTTRPDLFAHDKRLRYRVGGYRGRRGDALADYLIQNVIEPAFLKGTSRTAS
jgi:hypothetical protein